jgi:hypothetical protein
MTSDRAGIEAGASSTSKYRRARQPVGGHIGDRPASVPVAARRRRGTHRGQTRLRPRRCSSSSGDTSGTDPPPSPSLPVVVGGHIGDRPASVPVVARRRRGTHRCPSSHRTPPTVRRDLKVAAAPFTPTERGRQPANSPRRQRPLAGRIPKRKSTLHQGRAHEQETRRAPARPEIERAPSARRPPRHRASRPRAAFLWRTAPGRTEGPPPAVVGQLADDDGGRRSPPGPCAHVARGLRFEGAAARAEPRSFSRSP